MRDALHSLPLLAALAGALLLGSCGLLGSDQNETENTNTYFRATLNGEEAWSAEGTRKTNFLTDGEGREWLTLALYNFPGSTSRYSYREGLSFIVIFKGAGTYSLVEVIHGEGEETGAFFYEIEGDVLIASYRATDDTSANQLTIASYDSTTGVMEGTFRTTVVVDSSERVVEPGEPARRRADTLRFTDGEFRQMVGDQRDE